MTVTKKETAAIWLTFTTKFRLCDSSVLEVVLILNYITLSHSSGCKETYLLLAPQPFFHDMRVSFALESHCSRNVPALKRPVQDKKSFLKK